MQPMYTNLRFSDAPFISCQRHMRRCHLSNVTQLWLSAVHLYHPSNGCRFAKVCCTIPLLPRFAHSFVRNSRTLPPRALRSVQLSPTGSPNPKHRELHFMLNYPPLASDRAAARHVYLLLLSHTLRSPQGLLHCLCRH